VVASGVNRSQPYVRIRRMVPKTNFVLHAEERPLPAALSCRIEEKEAWAGACPLPKWIEDLIAGVSQ